MLVIRLQRTGRSGHAQFRVVVQDSRFSPTSGRVVAYVGSYNPHTKVAAIDKEKIAGYLSNGAQPSPRVASLLKKESVKLPSWVKTAKPSKKAIKHPEKLRRNRPAGEPAPEAKPEAEEPEAEETPATGTPAEETPAQESAETESIPVEEKTEPETPAETAEPEPEAVNPQEAQEAVKEDEVEPVAEKKEEPKAEAKS
jgi:small subunit ribosomal protein S16